VCFAPVVQVIRVDDFDDPRIADYQNLKDKQLLASRGRFVVEGRVNLRVMLERSPFVPDSILLSERDPMDLVQGLLAVEAAPRIVVLEGVFNLDNIGGIFRNSMALGGRAVLLCPRSVDPLYRKAIRTSMGATLVVPFARTDDLGALLDGLKEAGFEILALDPAEDGVDLDDLAASEVGPAALLLGTEGEGLSEEALARADRRVRIAMEPGVDSLNVSVAAGIALARLRDRNSDTANAAG